MKLVGLLAILALSVLAGCGDKECAADADCGNLQRCGSEELCINCEAQCEDRDDCAAGHLCFISENGCSECR